MPETTPRAVLHVGAPKTGTTYLQAVLWRNRAALRGAGVLYPLRSPGEHFAAALDVREMSWGGRADGAWLGTWSRLAERIEAWEGSVLLSNELLGGVGPEQARTIADVLAGAASREVHVVFTARDLARQLPSDWQEHIKHRHDVCLSTFVDDLVRLGPAAPAPFGELFWGLHDAEQVLSTWASVLPPEQLHLVVVPRAGGGSHELWQRFSRAAGLADLAPGLDLDVDLDLDVEPRNVSLGVAEAELLRRLNALLPGRLVPRQYDDLVRKVLAEQILVSVKRGVAPSERPTLPAANRPWVIDRSRQLVEAVRSAGYDVVGDLDDLVPLDGTGGRQPEELHDGDLLAVAFDAISGLLRELGEGADRAARHGDELRALQTRVLELESELVEARAERDYWRDGGVAHRLVRFSDQHSWLRPARRAYSSSRRLLRREDGAPDADA